MRLSTATSSDPRDAFGRPIRDLRISVIDRCNLRCTFCMPADQEYSFLPKGEILSFEEITRLAGIFLRLGVRKIRLTGGEPLLRSEIEKLVAMLSRLDGLEDLALTTNGFLLAQKAALLKSAGLDRVTVSLQSLDDDLFGRVNGRGLGLAQVLEGIERAAEVGLGPLKVNVVAMKGVNGDEILEIARFFKERRHIVRFIEYMDVGTVNGWNLDAVISARQILETIAREMPATAVDRRHPSDVALRFRYVDDGVEVGAIASITEPFCGDCARARLSSDGQLFTCLFAESGTDLKAPLRAGLEDAEIEDLIRGVWSQRTDRYSEERTEALRRGQFGSTSQKVEMFRIGG